MTVREIALKLLMELEADGKYANLSLSSGIVRSLDERERAWLTVLFYTTLEHKLTYDYIISALAKREIGKIDLRTKNILRLGMCQVLHITGVPDFAAVSETVALARHKGEGGFVNGILRSLLRARDKGEIPMPKREKSVARFLSVKYSYPLWLVKHFISVFGEEECERLLDYYNTERYTDLTVNTTKISVEDFLTRLKDSGFTAELSKRVSQSVRISTSYDPRVLPGFDDGCFFVQDEACLVSASVLDTKEGMRVLDACSAPGGKSFSVAILTSDKADITSADIHESKLSLIESGASRLGLRSVRVTSRDASVIHTEEERQYDRVLCDVPCSGLGVLGKKPDLRYRSEESIKGLPELQYSILESSAHTLKSGGILVYSTCTLNPEENEGVVKHFLSENSDFSPIDFTVGDLSSVGGTLTLIPSVHKTDGFFIAKLRKDI